MNSKVSAVIGIAVVAALAGALVVRQRTAHGQPPRDDLEVQRRRENILDAIQKLKADGIAPEEQMKLLRELHDIEGAEYFLTQKAQHREDRKPADLKPNAPNQRQGEMTSRWEYKVLTLSEKDEAANRDMDRLTHDGWEYVGVVQPARPRGTVTTANTSQLTEGTPARLLFKRPMR
jgi:hypothetical protein